MVPVLSVPVLSGLVELRSLAAGKQHLNNQFAHIGYYYKRVHTWAYHSLFYGRLLPGTRLCRLDIETVRIRGSH